MTPHHENHDASQTKTFDLLVIGSGPGGYIAALKAAHNGMDVAIVERDHLGGTCLNRGCIPSKALLSSAEMLHQMQHAKNWGIRVDGEVTHDWPAITKHKDRVIRQLRGGINLLLKKRNVTQLPGTAEFIAPHQVRITHPDNPPQIVRAKNVIVATGSTPASLPGWPTDQPELVCNSDQAVHWTDLPKSLAIIGGGAIGCEFACMMQPMGVQVTLIELAEHLLPHMDREMGEGYAKILKSRGIAVHTGISVKDLTTSDKPDVTLRLSDDTQMTVDRVLVSVGRRPVVDALNPGAAGIGCTSRGFIEVDDHLSTQVEGHYAIGDVTGRCLLAHAATEHAHVVCDNLNGQSRLDHAPIPNAVYSFPEIANVGMTEQDCRRREMPIEVGSFPVGHLGKAMASRHTEGLVKVIRHMEDGTLLGVAMLGHNATECIAQATAMLHHRLTVEQAGHIVVAHPTIGESIKEAIEDSMGMAMHLPPRQVPALG